MSLDIRKAFDSIGHQFLSKVLDFFNIGPNMKKWLLLLSTNPTACIKLDNKNKTKYFKLARGNAQGDIISPFLFLLGYQILLFKLNFDLQILGTADNPPENPAPLGLASSRPRGRCNLLQGARHGRRCKLPRTDGPEQPATN